MPHKVFTCAYSDGTKLISIIITKQSKQYSGVAIRCRLGTRRFIKRMRVNIPHIPTDLLNFLTLDLCRFAETEVSVGITSSASSFLKPMPRFNRNECI